MNENTTQTNYKIDYMEILMVLWQRIWVLILCFALGFVGVFSYYRYFVTPLYRSSATIYVFSKNTSISDLTLNRSLSADFSYILLTREVLNGVIDEMGLNMTYGMLRSQVAVDNPADSHMLRVTVTNSDPQMASDISNELADTLRKQIAVIMNTAQPSVVERAVPAGSPVGMNATRNSILAGALLAGGVGAIYVVLNILDDSVKDGDDVKRYLGLEVLAEIPYDPSMASRDSSRKKRGKMNQAGRKFAFKKENSQQNTAVLKRIDSDSQSNSES